MKREVKSLLRKARRSLEAARLLHSQGYLDFAASRAYYSMFYIAEALLLQQGLSFSSHSAVIAAFGKEFAKTDSLAAKFHPYLIDAQDLRNSADYDIGPDLASSQVEALLQWTVEFLTEAELRLSG